jgi:hypothetical protein
MSFDPVAVNIGDVVTWDGVDWLVAERHLAKQEVELIRNDAEGESYRIRITYERAERDNQRHQPFQEQLMAKMMRTSFDNNFSAMLQKLAEQAAIPPQHVNARNEIAAIKGTEDLDQKYRALKAEGYNVVWEMDGDLFHRGLTVERVQDIEAAWAFVDYLNDDEAGEPLAIRQDDEVLYHRTSGSWQKDERCKEPIPAAYAPKPKSKPGVTINFVQQDSQVVSPSAYDELLKLAESGAIGIVDLKKMMGL